MIRFLRPLSFALLLLAAAGGVSAQTVFVMDQFTGTNGTTLQAHSPNTGAAWTRVIGSNLNIQTNTLRATAVNAGDIYTNGTTAPAANYVVGMSVTFTNANANNYINLIGRGNVNAQQGYLAQLQANGAMIVWPVTGGTIGAPIINTIVAMTLNVQHVFILQMIGNQISVFFDGTQTGPVTNNAVAGPGVVGLGLNANNIAQVTADNFFAGTFAVTEARMRTMMARRHDGRALVEWATGREVSNLGFRVWRQDGERRTLLTPSLVAGSAFLTSSTLTAGNRYRWLDDDATPRSRYWIESIGLDGRREWNGPVVPVTAPFDETAAAPLLRDLGQHVAPAAARSRLTIVANGTHRAVAPSLLPKQQVLAAGAAVKISVDADGWYRVTRDELLAAGLDSATDPHRLHLYADVSEVAITVEGESQNRIDAIRFYGTALDTPSTATRVYWLVAGDGQGRRIETSTSTATGPTPTSFIVTAERRDKTYFFAALLNGESESFFGPVISNDPTRPATQTLRLDHIDRTPTTADIEISLQGATDDGDDPAHDVAVTLNGQSLDDIRFSGRDSVTVHRVVPIGSLAAGDNTLTFVAKNGDVDISLISSVRITYAHTYDFDSGPLMLTAAGGNAVAVHGATSTQISALDVTAPAAPVEIPVAVDGGVARFVTPAGAQHTIIVTPAFARPLLVEANQPSSLHSAAGADMIIITHRSLLPAIEPLRQLRASQGLSVLVATVGDIYDEYGYGEKDPAALRMFIEATRRWTRVPRYVLLVGDATFDPRNYLGFGDFDLVPTKLIVTRELKTASDSWLTDFDDDGAADVAIAALVYAHVTPMHRGAEALKPLSSLLT